MDDLDIIMHDNALSHYLRSLWLQGVELWLEEDQIRFRGNKKALTPDTIGELKANKQAIIALLQDSPLNYSGFPLSASQNAIYIQQALAKENPSYHITTLVKLTQPIHHKALSDSIDTVLQRHAPLRMGVTHLDGHLAQQVKYSLPNILTHQSLKDHKALNEYIKTEATRSFDLIDDALIRAYSLTIDNEGTFLLVIAHHIVADFWALNLFLQEVQAVYLALSQQRSVELNPISRLFKDYVMDEIDWQQNHSESAQKYWQTKLQPSIALTHLFKDSASINSHQGEEESFQLPVHIVKQLQTKSQQAQCSIFIWVLSCFQIWLSLQTKQTYFAIGTPLTGRHNTDWQKIAGQFTNLSCFITNITQYNHFNALLDSNKAQLNQLLRHQRLPFQKVQEIAKQKGITTLFEQAFSWNQFQHGDAYGLYDEIISTGQQGALYPLTLTGFDKGDAIILQWRFPKKAFNKERVAFFNQSLLRVIEQSLSDTKPSIDAFTLVSKYQLDALYDRTSSKQQATLSKKAHLNIRFKEVVLQYPNAIAYQNQIAQLSYQALDLKANQIANNLNMRGITSQDTVALMLPRSMELVSAIIACIKLNAIFVPIQVETPLARLQTMLKTVQCQHIITLDEHLDVDISQSRIDDYQSDSASHFMVAENDLDEDHIACILFTSGSTGTPKAVPIPHRALIRLGLDNGFLSLKPNDRMAYAANPAFDASNIELWNTLLNGATLFEIDQTDLLSVSALEAQLQQVDALFMTTALFQLYMAQNPEIFSPVKQVLTGGEALDQTIAAQWLERYPDALLTNLYGPTENGTVSSFHPVSARSVTLPNIPIGQAINHSEIMVLNENLALCPPYVVGEIAVAGKGLSSGYFKVAKHAAFRLHQPQDKLIYLTGDQGYINSQGEIHFVGRQDEQIKINGYRIEIAEIEAVIATYPGIVQFSLVNQPHGLTLYFSHDDKLHEQTIKTFLAEKLPAYMLPKHYLQLDQLPLNANGKINKKALPTIDLNNQRKDAVFSPQEQAISHLFADLLNKTPSTKDDDFFALGGDSLLAMRCIHRLQTEFGLLVEVKDFFSQPTIAAVAQLPKQHVIAQIAPLSENEKTQPLKLPNAPKRLWFLQRLFPNDRAYHMPFTLYFEQNITHQTMDTALQKLLNQSKIFHCAIKEQQGIPYFYYEPKAWFLPFLDLSKLGEHDKATALNQQLDQIRTHVIDLTQAPLLKAIYIKLTENRYVLALNTHHILVDGESVLHLLAQLADQLQGKPTQQPQIDFLDYCADTVKQSSQTDHEKVLGFWQDYLNNVPYQLNLSALAKKTPSKEAHGAKLNYHLSAKTTEQIYALVQTEKVSLFTVLASCYNLLLSRYTGENTVCSGFPVAARTSQTEAMIGLFANNLMIKSDFGQHTHFVSVLKAYHKDLCSVVEHAEVGFDEIIERLNISRQLNSIPFVQASIQLQTTSLAEQVDRYFGDKVKAHILDTEANKYDLHFDFCYQQSQLTLEVTYAAHKFDHGKIVEFTEHYCRLLDQISLDPCKPLKNQGLLSQQEITRVLQKDLAQPIQTVPVLLKLQRNSEQFPNSIALTEQTQKFSYQSLEERSNQLAHALIQQGIKPNDFIGIACDKSAHWVITMIAILKTGAAYVPFDWQFPESRNHFIAEDAGLALLISDQNNGLKATQNIDLSSLWKNSECLPITPVNMSISPSQTAYIIYTSGTTGKPKGCPISHHQLARLMTTTEQKLNLSATDQWCFFHSQAFDFSVWEIWGALYHGANLHIVEPSIAKQTDRFYEFISQNNISVLNQTPSAFSRLIAVDQQKSLPLSLNKVIFGGEALEFNILAEWIQLHPLSQTALINMYGITETTVHVTCHEIQAEEINGHESIIGESLADLGIQILDQAQQIAPYGVTGEIAVTGSGLSKGYLNQKALSASKFIDNPYVTDITLDAKRYLTGDLGRFNSNGKLVYLGRKDNQINLRGYRIELAEIESVMQQFHGVKQAKVLLKHNHDDAYLVGYYVISQTIERIDLNYFLQQQLPDYMIPKALILLDELPITGNGKIDTTQLPSATLADYSSTPFIAPRNETESILVDIWQQYLPQEKIGIQDNFFQIGGHSLIATQIGASVSETFHCDLSVQAVFEHPTIEQLALHILSISLETENIDDDELLQLLAEIENEVD